MKKTEIFFDAITNIREDLIEEALDYQFYKRTIPWQRYLRNVACLALVVLVGFGAVRLGLFGGWGGSDSANNTASDAAGSDMLDDTTGNSAPPESADKSEFPTEPSTGSQNNYGDNGPVTDGEESTFTATILEVHENYLLVEPADGEDILSSADRIEVPIMDMENIDQFAAGDVISITFTGQIQETYPARVTEVLEITPAE